MNENKKTIYKMLICLLLFVLAMLLLRSIYNNSRTIASAENALAELKTNNERSKDFNRAAASTTANISKGINATKEMLENSTKHNKNISNAVAQAGKLTEAATGNIAAANSIIDDCNKILQDVETQK